MNEFSKTIIIIGIVLIIVGILSIFIAKVPGIGKLPGDIFVKKENFTFYFPITTCILASIVISILIYLWNHR